QSQVGDALGEDHEVCAAETGAGHDEAIEFKKISCRGDRLRRLIFEGVISPDLDSEGCQILEVGEFQRALCLDCDQVQLMLDAARPDRLQREPISDLGEGAVAFKAGIEDLEFTAAGTPASVRSRAAQRVAAPSGNAPSFARETFRINRLKRVEDPPVMSRPAADHAQV